MRRLGEWWSNKGGYKMKYRKYGRVYRLSSKKNGLCIDCAFIGDIKQCPVYDNQRTICAFSGDGKLREMNYNFRETLF